MAKTSMTLLTTVIAAALSLTAACSGHGAVAPLESTTSTTVTTKNFPYPGVRTVQDVVPSIAGTGVPAAEIAIKWELLHSDWMISHQEEVPHELLSIVTANNKPEWMPSNVMEGTGGELIRAVNVREIDRISWEVSVCNYDTPGVYYPGEAGQLKLGFPTWAQYASTATVVLTSGPDGTGATSSGPRLLISRTTLPLNDEAHAICDPFRPDPFIQQPPEPLPAHK
ncbi:hypothetical protein GCM10011591_42250 [Nocardia camponoti]|uniref:Lipoprotein n=1 Tax=Nocardia camponoti TaxID=1616106 RepID=A0A917VDG9_9NOCA|nr:hypothetical protein GCM10011591_42250 [Nocardia camponoti]